jgi:hypothetical protein
MNRSGIFLTVDAFLETALLIHISLKNILYCLIAIV